MKYLIVIAFALFAAVNALDFDRPCRNEEVSPNVKTGFQIAAYLGTWYEVQRYEAQNQTGLDCVNARYSLNADGSVEVDNTGYTSAGQFIQFVGRATVAFPDQVPLPAKLLVSFFPGRKFKEKFACDLFLINFRSQNHQQSTGDSALTTSTMPLCGVAENCPEADQTNPHGF